MHSGAVMLVEEGMVVGDGKSKDCELRDVTADSSLLEVLAPSGWKKRAVALALRLNGSEIFLHASRVSPLMLLQRGREALGCEGCCLLTSHVSHLLQVLVHLFSLASPHARRMALEQRQ
jgi:hypothetical protein